LLPIDARTGTGDAPALDRQAVSAEAIRDKLKAAGARVTLLILDACRDGPGSGKSGSKGLARIGGGNGLLVAYATEEDQVAQDGKGRNSPYAEALAQALKRTDLPILEQLDWVADEVHRKEPGQMPTRDGNLRAKAYLVNAPVGQGTTGAQTQVASIKPEPNASIPASPAEYFVQVGAYRDEDSARMDAQKLLSQGFDGKITVREQSGQLIYRLRVGPFVNQVAADPIKHALDKNGWGTAMVRAQK
jgi:cell division protein FtsN